MEPISSYMVLASLATAASNLFNGSRQRGIQNAQQEISDGRFKESLKAKADELQASQRHSEYLSILSHKLRLIEQEKYLQNLVASKNYEYYLGKAWPSRLDPETVASRVDSTADRVPLQIFFAKGNYGTGFKENFLDTLLELKDHFS
jgi:hypothetical protein